MRTIKPLLLCVYIAVMTAGVKLSIYGQTPPPNDDLTNAIILTGTDVTFSGSTVGATLEDSTDANISEPYFYPSASVWWSWTAPTNGVLTLELQQYQMTVYDEPIDNALFILTATNGVTKPAGLNLPPIGVWALIAGIPYQSFSIPVTAGTIYKLSLAGNGPYTYNMRLRLTNAPVILKQPVSQTVYSNGETVFYAVAGGLQPKSYQWFFNGNAMPGETAAILEFTNVTASTTGSYSVAVSNSTGTTMSDPAVLAISQSNVPPLLCATGFSPDLAAFTLAGELGRAYGIESSTNLTDWVPEMSFPVTPQVDPRQDFDQYVYTTNATISLSATNSSAVKYYRAFIFKPGYQPGDMYYPDLLPAAETCVNNLRRIAAAKLLYRLDTLSSWDYFYPSYCDIAPYMRHPETLICPLDETQTFSNSYSLTEIEGGGYSRPSCKIGLYIGHHLSVVP